MCTYSMVVDGWKNPLSPNHIPWKKDSPSPDEAKLMLEILEKIDKLDKKVDALNCKLKEKEKNAFVRKLKRRASKTTKSENHGSQAR